MVVEAVLEGPTVMVPLVVRVALMEVVRPVGVVEVLVAAQLEVWEYAARQLILLVVQAVTILVGAVVVLAQPLSSVVVELAAE